MNTYMVTFAKDTGGFGEDVEAFTAEDAITIAKLRMREFLADGRYEIVACECVSATIRREELPNNPWTHTIIIDDVNHYGYGEGAVLLYDGKVRKAWGDVYDYLRCRNENK